MTIFLTIEFIIYTLILWALNLFWINIVGSVFIKRLPSKSENNIHKEIDTFENVSIIGIGPFLLVWVTVTPFLFGAASGSLAVDFIRFTYWPETLLCLTISIILSYYVVRVQILKKNKDDEKELENRMEQP